MDEFSLVRFHPDRMAAFRSFGVDRTRINSRLGHKNRHPGLPSVVAHAVGEMGEEAVGDFLKRNGIPFHRGPNMTTDYRKIRQDFIIGDRSVGVKARLVTQGRFPPCFLYPDKNQVAGKRLLGYPDWVLACDADFDRCRVRLLGVFSRKVVRAGSVGPVNGFPTHRVPWWRIVPLEKFSRMALFWVS